MVVTLGAVPEGGQRWVRSHHPHLPCANSRRCPLAAAVQPWREKRSLCSCATGYRVANRAALQAGGPNCAVFASRLTLRGGPRTARRAQCWRVRYPGSPEQRMRLPGPRRSQPRVLPNPMCVQASHDCREDVRREVTRTEARHLPRGPFGPRAPMTASASITSLTGDSVVHACSDFPSSPHELEDTGGGSIACPAARRPATGGAAPAFAWARRSGEYAVKPRTRNLKPRSYRRSAVAEASLADFSTIWTPVSAFDTGHSFLACSAIRWNSPSSNAGTSASVSKSIRVMASCVGSS